MPSSAEACAILASAGPPRRTRSTPGWSFSTTVAARPSMTPPVVAATCHSTASVVIRNRSGSSSVRPGSSGCRPYYGTDLAAVASRWAMPCPERSLYSRPRRVRIAETPAVGSQRVT